MVKMFFAPLCLTLLTFACGEANQSNLADTRPRSAEAAKLSAEIAGVYQNCITSAVNNADKSEALYLVIRPDASTQSGFFAQIEKAKWSNSRDCFGNPTSVSTSGKGAVDLTKKGVEYVLTLSQGTLNGSSKENMTYRFKKEPKSLLLIDMTDKDGTYARNVQFQNITYKMSGTVLTTDAAAKALVELQGTFKSCLNGSFNTVGRSESIILSIESVNAENVVNLKKAFWTSGKDCVGPASSTSDLASGVKEVRKGLGTTQIMFTESMLEGSKKRDVIYEFKKFGKDLKLVNIITINTEKKHVFDQDSEVMRPQDILLKRDAG